MSKRINNISPNTENAILRKTAYSLPNRPSESGMRAEDVKKAFYSGITDESNSIMSEINRIVNEANNSLEEIDKTLADKEESDKNNYKAIDFSESERQKTLNLITPYKGWFPITSNGLTTSYIEETGELRIQGIASNSGSSNWLSCSTYHFKVELKAGVTYTLSTQNATGTWNKGATIVHTFYKKSNGFQATTISCRFGETDNVQTYTPTEDVYLYSSVAWFDVGAEIDVTFSMQIEEGSSKTPYKKWSGDVVHKDDIWFMNKYEVIYDRTVDSKDWGYPSGIPVETTVTGLDLTKYKQLMVFATWVEVDPQKGCAIIDLEQESFSGSGYWGGIVYDLGVDAGNNNYLFGRFCECKVNTAKTTFTCTYAGLRENGGYSHNYARPVKIIGVY